MYIITTDEYKKAGQKFDWATAEHYKIYLTGSLARHPRTERILPRLANSKYLVTRNYGKKLIYAVKSKKNYPVEHGLGVTETIVRVCRSRSGGEFKHSREFRGLGSIPDWGIDYDGRLLLVEFSTKDNFHRYKVIHFKMTSYAQNLNNIIRNFNATQAVVLFVVDVSRERVKNFLKRNPFDDPYLFIDFETFKSVKIGQQFKEEIYLWGGDDKNHPLGQ